MCSLCLAATALFPFPPVLPVGGGTMGHSHSSLLRSMNARRLSDRPLENWLKNTSSYVRKKQKIRHSS